jgi:hypothetical protein
VDEDDVESDDERYVIPSTSTVSLLLILTCPSRNGVGNPIPNDGDTRENQTTAWSGWSTSKTQAQGNRSQAQVDQTDNQMAEDSSDEDKDNDSKSSGSNDSAPGKSRNVLQPSGVANANKSCLNNPTPACVPPASGQGFGGH